MPIYGMRTRDRWARRIGVLTLGLAAVIALVGTAALASALIVWGLSLVAL